MQALWKDGGRVTGALSRRKGRRGHRGDTIEERRELGVIMEEGGGPHASSWLGGNRGIFI